MNFVRAFFEFLLDILTTDAKPQARVVVYRNYAVGPFDFAEVK